MLALINKIPNFALGSLKQTPADVVDYKTAKSLQ